MEDLRGHEAFSMTLEQLITCLLQTANDMGESPSKVNVITLAMSETGVQIRHEGKRYSEGMIAIFEDDSEIDLPDRGFDPNLN